jgi:hypothetical protein
MMTGIEVSPLRGSRRRFFAGADVVGAKHYLRGVVGENLERHEMANILGNANEASPFFTWNRSNGPIS